MAYRAAESSEHRKDHAANSGDEPGPDHAVDDARDARLAAVRLFVRVVQAFKSEPQTQQKRRCKKGFVTNSRLLESLKNQKLFK